MPKALRSNFEPGSPREAVRRAQWKALGLTDDDLLKPKIAGVTPSSELAICFSHLDGIAKVVKEAVRDAGGMPFEIRTAAPSDFIISAGAGGGYMLASRDLIVNDMEIAVEGAQLDGMICLSSCDKTPPGHLMAAGRFNIPSILVLCGYQPAGHFEGKHVDIEDVFLGSVQAMFGKLSKETLRGMCDHAIGGPGVCSGLGTANSMHIVCEALGMALPGSTPVAANSPKMMETVRQAGQRIVQMVWDDLKPRDILTPGAFANAVRAILAVGGSINSVKHMQAVASEAGCAVDVYGLFERLANETPVLTAVRPVGEHSIEEFEAAGGARAVLKQLEPLLNGNVLTVTGKSLKENLDQAVIDDSEIVRPLSRPVATKPAIVLVRGSLAPDAGIVKVGIDPHKKRRFEGEAICFSTSDEALAGIKGGAIKPGHVVVMRGAGVCGGPGMGGGASRVVFALDGAGLGEQVALLTDGHLSGLVCKGLVVGEVAPEAAAGGPLALVEDGDRIVIDLGKRVCDLEVPPAELEARRARWRAPPPNYDSGWLRIYPRNVRPPPKSGVLTGEK